MGDSKDMIIFSVGPVQSFIAAARRTQDLAAGSKLLSWLSECIIKHARENGLEIVYPKIVSGTSGNLPNRLVLLAEHGKGAEVAEELEKEVRRAWGEVFSEKLSKSIRKVWNSMAVQQMKEFLEIYWVVQPWDGLDANYPTAYQHASMGLNARKSMRRYPSTSQPGIKCTLCGIRSALHDSDAKQDWDELSTTVGLRVLRKNERLCAVCTAKRLGQRIGFEPLANLGHFPSTSDIAVASFRVFIEKNWSKLNGTALTYLQKLQSAGFISKDDEEWKRVFHRLDGDLFFGDFYRSENRVKEFKIDLSDESRTQIISSLKDMISAVGLSPNPYYAILIVDGDKMGELLDYPAKYYKGDNETHKNLHQRISSALANAAEKMAKEAQEYHATVVYSGGDDALIFLPVDTLLPAAKHLQQIFTDELAKEGFEKRHASAGAVIVHHQSPLSRAIADARRAELDAKDAYDRNALAVWLLRRSGEPRRAIMHWNEELLTGLDEFRQLIVEDVLSGAMAYQFKEAASALPDRAIKLELKRLLARHSPDKSPSVRINAMLENLLNGMNGIKEIPITNRANQLAEWLVIMRFLAKGEL